MKLRDKEVKETPPSHRAILGVKQRRQDSQALIRRQNNPETGKSSHKAVPDDLKLPWEVYQDVPKDHNSYVRFRELIDAEKYDLAEQVKNKII